MKKFRVTFELDTSLRLQHESDCYVYCLVEAESITGAVDKAAVWFYIQYPHWVDRITKVSIVVEA